MTNPANSPPKCSDDLAAFIIAELTTAGVTGVTTEIIKQTLDLAATRLPLHLRMKDPAAGETVVR